MFLHDLSTLQESSSRVGSPHVQRGVQHRTALGCRIEARTAHGYFGRGRQLTRRHGIHRPRLLQTAPSRAVVRSSIPRGFGAGLCGSFPESTEGRIPVHTSDGCRLFPRSRNAASNAEGASNQGCCGRFPIYSGGEHGELGFPPVRPEPSGHVVHPRRARRVLHRRYLRLQRVSQGSA